eukprot:c39201_g1_i1.p1 GENE.c39201_g1_i1~~c39201_g1_i1.p1  ORF type:complete len:735 (+),score=163.83 c39201_g1_i1:35-2239(+)
MSKVVELVEVAAPPRKRQVRWPGLVVITCSLLSCVSFMYLFGFPDPSHGLGSRSSGTVYGIGVGTHDITGPAAEVNMMGYALLSQTSAGIHMRLRSRAFLFVDRQTNKRVVFVSLDIGMAGQLTKLKVVENLNKIYPGIYTEENVCISGTHTHSAQAGFLQYTLFQVSSLGYVPEAANAIIDGVVQSIIKAHESEADGQISINQGLLFNASINRSPTAYFLNPAAERRQYETVGNLTDNLMVLLKLTDAVTGAPRGALNWFAVHGTSMNNTNQLMSGDNKGYASYLFEKRQNPNGTIAGNGSFVAAFASTNLGDVSPNTKGPHCLDTGLPCDLVHSTCNNRTELCAAFGPGRDMFESTKIIGEKQFNKAVELFLAANTSISGNILYAHRYLHMPSVVVAVNSTHNTTLCPSAMGYAFAAGTTDGCGMFDFVQGTTSGNPFWDAISHVLAKPTAAQIACHAPKPILLDTADITFPYEWDPQIVPIQIFKIGQLVILSVPGEFTTMSGRRLRNAVKARLVERGILDNNGVVVIAGLANTYASYITTFEEYQQQRYEGASTIYGPNTLNGYISEFLKLVDDLGSDSPDPGPSPPNLEPNQWSLLPPVLFDGTPFGVNYGDVVENVQSSYSRGSRVRVVFQSANPRNNLRTQDTFLRVERLDGTQWTTVAVDADWETQYHWKRVGGTLSDRSLAEILWDIPADAQPGTYRIRHLGDAKHIIGGIKPFQGTSASFTVTA